MRRRGFLRGLICAPAVVRTPGLLMPIGLLPIRALEAFVGLADCGPPDLTIQGLQDFELALRGAWANYTIAPTFRLVSSSELVAGE